MSAFPRKWCLNIFNKMREMNMTKLLIQEIISRQSNFSVNFDSISEKLNNNSYKSTREWIDEMNMVLLNEQRYYEKNPHFYTIVQYIQKWFEKKVKYVPSTELDAWLVDYQKVQKHMAKLSRLSIT